jgi:quinol monooxygenase YgiN
MLIVTGSIKAQREHLPRVLELSLEHVNRSRREPGCLFHSVHRDVEDENRLVFLEHWADTDVLRAHFAVPASIAFVQEAASLAEEAPTLEIYEAQPTSV